MEVGVNLPSYKSHRSLLAYTALVPRRPQGFHRHPLTCKLLDSHKYHRSFGPLVALCCGMMVSCIGRSRLKVFTPFSGTSPHFSAVGFSHSRTSQRLSLLHSWQFSTLLTGRRAMFDRRAGFLSQITRGIVATLQGVLSSRSQKADLCYEITS